ncbi:MAG: c-type cytochrome [Candidatus Thiodiazotropha endolucinida]|uniref:Cytochrome c n=2 Tax=Candidatus Thiodiazotropha TaxID=1913444 RepID=A0A7Z1AHI7_9GAMM|nr:c-type cytochrome [Candidatus Thiodiazotropha endolucinida]MBT3016080.1 c-type cytochrome [Candidatus Thiodiazotropha taylori]MBT3029972.1 c-type cytochrome [Candidatus Thiodiazotropha sp. (ex Lucina pensylvanica)]MBT3038681.1 c-type cytochrome [Candidatus Thiodiazotropha sp. (ex Codakia orbicularis)]MBT3049334.1 c-type cytochrome [Candidatus Thiodiazotropha sp. (ex Codakia orbicularis)]MBV2125595.1 c-type cytochrome [Candidatus Thiodiazotropha taylori]
MSVLLKTLGFSLGLTLLFTLVTYILPQVEGEAPVEKAVDLSALTMDDFIALGEDLFNNKGTCTLCHKPAPLGRAPDIQGADMVSLINERLADANYQGEAKDAAGYILESMIEPGRYVVPTWGKKGTNDTESPMPAVDKAPIELSSIEMDAIIAYLQAKDGNEVTVSLPSPEEAESVAGAEAIASGSAALPTPAATAEEALGKFACSSCHALDSADTLVGPGLVDIGARLSKEEIRQSIIDPNAVIAEGFPAAMPADLAEKMTVKELELLVTYLAEKK